MRKEVITNAIYGGKFRQSKAIVEVLRPYITSDTVYVEPFCGGMWSAAYNIGGIYY